MIGTALIGGLGNQMFQYAAARALALRHGTRVALDLSVLGRTGGAIVRSYELDRLQIAVASPSWWRDFRFLLAHRPQSVFQRTSGWSVLRESTSSYDASVTQAGDGTYLFGYWQSWRYFDAWRAQIAAELQPRMPLSARNRDLLKTMRATPSVSLHVRRGDYLHALHAVHGSLGLDYYVRGVERILGVEPGASIYVFSDDLDWCRDAFEPFGWRTSFVDWNRDDDSWQDMFLMGGCRHAIVANSSFSWWGAWLGDQTSPDGRIVIAPARWFAGRDTSVEDRCPPGWTRI